MLPREWLGVSFMQFIRDLGKEINEDEIFNGAATLAFFLMLALFPAMIFLLSLLPFLPIDSLHQAIMDFMAQLLPAQSAKLFSGVISEVTENQNSRLLSFGLIAAFWAASSGMYAIMQQLNKTDALIEHDHAEGKNNGERAKAKNENLTHRPLPNH